MITLHHLNNSRSQRVLWLLEELEVPYQVVRHARDAETSLAPPELERIHPLGKSPVIETEDGVIAESGAIIDHLCARHAPHMAPKDGAAGLEHLQLMHFAEGSAMTPILLNLYVSRLGDAAAPLRPRIDGEMTRHFGYMEQILRPSGHFVLDQLSAADVLLSFPAEVAVKSGFGDTLPRLKAFVEMIQARPAYQRALEVGGPYRFA